jgi:hypothetical protein
MTFFSMFQLKSRSSRRLITIRCTVATILFWLKRWGGRYWRAVKPLFLILVNSDLQYCLDSALNGDDTGVNRSFIRGSPLMEHS